MTVTPVWTPDASAAARSQLAAFLEACRHQAPVPVADYAALQAWAAERPDAFWGAFLDWCDLPTGGSAVPAMDGHDVQGAQFFPGVSLNFAECILRPLAADDGHWPALTAVDETGRRHRLTRGELRQAVARTASGLSALGLRRGERVAGIVRNTEDAVVLALACAWIGATWSAASPDMGADAIVGRFGQLEPALLVAHGVWSQQGVRRDLRERLQQVAAQLPTLRGVVALDDMARSVDFTCPVHSLSDLQARDESPAVERFPFDHPLYVMFSSGTTGLPKCIVHGAGGTLLEHLKEHRLHCDAAPGDVLLFQTTCGWMMWQWMVSALGAGVEVVLYDGSVSYPTPDQLLRVIDESGVTLFGTNPTYLQFLRDSAMVPRELFPFAALRGVMSTGSVLGDSLYDWMRDAFKAVPLQSISGGTDIIGCFVLGNPLLPVYRGESQCISLGLDVQVLTEAGLSRQGRGELVCCRPFPSRPVGFLNDPDGNRFHTAYFSQNPGMWTHGDHVELTSRGTARVLGRSDSTLNVRGIRIGPAEIYSVVQQIEGVQQMLAVEQRDAREPGGSRIVLLLVLESGVELDRALSLRIKKELATRASANHVPGLILAVPELPTTFSGKISERAARDALNGDPVANRAALRNPTAVEHLERSVRGSA